MSERRFAGVDPGRVRVGLAIADDDGTMAFARGHVSGEGTAPDVARRIGDALADYGPTDFAVGVALGLDGSEGPAAKRAKILARAIRDVLGVRVVLVDERLTTVQATRSLRELGVTGKEARASIDAAAATVILQTYLDRRKSRAWQRTTTVPDASAPPREEAAAPAPPSQLGNPRREGRARRSRRSPTSS